MSFNNSFDVTISGAGPAGLAAGIQLVRAGHRVLLVEKKPACENSNPVIETLPAISKVLFHHLGINNADMEIFREWSGYSSVWGSTVLQERENIFNPYGSGWIIEKQKFNQILSAKAVKAGLICINASIIGDLGFDVYDNCYMVKIQNKNGETICLNSKWLIDASGRNRQLLKKLGVKAVKNDDLFSYSNVFSSSSIVDNYSFIESTEDGWWYSAALMNRKRIVSFFANKKNETGLKRQNYDRFVSLSAKSKRIHELILNSGSAQPEITGRHANSEKACQLYGNQWLAAGDAAVSFDPLSSQGIFTALKMGQQAGKAVSAALNGSMVEIRDYAKTYAELYDEYLLSRRLYYSMEKRWPRHPFWAASLRLT